MIITKFYLLQSNTTVSSSPSQQQGEFLKDLLAWVASSNAAGISFLINVISLILAIAGFLLYFQQKKESRLLSGILEEFNVKQRISKATDSAKSEKSKLDEQIANSRDQIKEAKRDLTERLPAEARRAYYENAIPVIQKQIYDLEKQLESMDEEIKKYEGTPSTASPHINEILGEEIRKHLSTQRDMDRSQSLLAILTAIAAAAGALLPHPLSVFTAIILGFLILKEAYQYWRLHRIYYSRASRRFRR